MIRMARLLGVQHDAEGDEWEVTLSATAPRCTWRRARERLQAERGVDALLAADRHPAGERPAQRRGGWDGRGRCVLVAVEAAISPEWDRYSGENRGFIRLQGFNVTSPRRMHHQSKAALAWRGDVFYRRGRRVGRDVVGWGEQEAVMGAHLRAHPSCLNQRL